MKKKILSLLIVIDLIAGAAMGQTQRTAGVNGCATDCFFTDCSVTCPPNTLPKCHCVLGAFGSCGCQLINTGTKSVDAGSLPTLKNQSVFPGIIAQLNKAGYASYANSLSALFSSLSLKDADAYKTNYANIQTMIDADPVTAAKVQDIIAGNFR